jgi:hypothetical protein
MPDGSRRPGRIAIGQPVKRPTGEFGCAVLADAMSTRVFTIFGVDGMQALMLALTFMGWELERFVSSGGRALYAPSDKEEDEQGDVEFDLALLMGPLFRAPPGTKPRRRHK